MHIRNCIQNYFSESIDVTRTRNSVEQVHTLKRLLSFYSANMSIVAGIPLYHIEAVVLLLFSHYHWKILTRADWHAFCDLQCGRYGLLIQLPFYTAENFSFKH